MKTRMKAKSFTLYTLTRDTLTLRADQLGSSSAGKDPGAVADSKPCEAVGPGLVQPRDASQTE